jgi:hypothetical protein
MANGTARDHYTYVVTQKTLTITPSMVILS